MLLSHTLISFFGLAGDESAQDCKIKPDKGVELEIWQVEDTLESTIALLEENKRESVADKIVSTGVCS